jgi:hypothetical protein
MKTLRITQALFIVVALCALFAPSLASAQGQDGWRVSIYPVFVWVPIGIDIDVNVPGEGAGGGSGSGSGPEFGGEIVDGRFDGAFLGGLSATNGIVRFDADGMWAAVGGDRLDRPELHVDVDMIYGRASGGIALLPDLYLTGGVRRFALKYEINLDGRDFTRKPGIWDPLIGVGWHHAAGTKLEFHASFDGGGFGVGADKDIGASTRFDWKPTTHFGFTAGYTYLYLKLSDDQSGRIFTVKQTLHGPVIGIGLYF